MIRTASSRGIQGELDPVGQLDADAPGVTAERLGAGGLGNGMKARALARRSAPDHRAPRGIA